MIIVTRVESSAMKEMLEQKVEGDNVNKQTILGNNHLRVLPAAKFIE